MAADRDTVLSWLSDLAGSIVTDPIDLDDMNSRIVAATQLSPADFGQEALQLMRAVAESVTSSADFDLIVAPVSEEGATRDALTILLAVGLAVAGVKATWPSRPAARNARTRLVDAGEAALAAAASFGGDGADLFGWISAVMSTAVRVISEIAANSVPVVRVETGISLPSTVLAYQMYGDAARAQGVVEIARSGTPMLMPVGFDALAR